MKKSAIKRWLCFPTGYFYFSPTGRDNFHAIWVGDVRQAMSLTTLDYAKFKDSDSYRYKLRVVASDISRGKREMGDERRGLPVAVTERAT